MTKTPRAALATLLILIGAGLPTPALAQIQAQLVVSGLTKPLAFVQDPSDPSVQVVAQQDGHIRAIKDGSLQQDDYLDLSGLTTANGELGLLGFAFAPDYGSSGRVFTYFIDANGNSVLARFVRSNWNPLQADPGSRFDIIWPDGNPFIYQPSPNHKGGNLIFGPDGYLYLGLGDGGPSNDPDNRAQDPGSLLGKMLRLDVSVPDSDPEGYDVPPDNPFVGMDGAMPEVWALGLRNPWRWSFDDPKFGGTGAMFIADVGQDNWEELNYEPPATGGRNYGWRIREGAHDYLTDPPPVIEPLIDPIYEYSHALTGYSITGGYVYRGQALDPAFNGRIFFADFVEGRVYSLQVVNNGTNDGYGTDLQDHTDLLGSGARGVSSFGVDASGELYLVSYSTGSIYRIVPGTAANGPTNVQMAVETPASGATTLPFTVSGWAVDLGDATTSGVDIVHVWAVPASGAAAIFLGTSMGGERADIAAQYGTRFSLSGFSVSVTTLPAGQYTILAFAHSSVTGNFERTEAVDVTVLDHAGDPRMSIDVPAPDGAFDGAFILAGWAFDAAAVSGTGISAVQVWAEREGDVRFVGNATIGIPRPDVAAAFGAQFANSGWGLVVGDLPPGAWTIRVNLKGAQTGTVIGSQSVPVLLNDGLLLQIDAPADGASTSGESYVAGWALDRGALHNPGVTAIHVWAVPSNGTPAIFLGQATLGVSRPDVGAAFGPQFANAGYVRSYSLAPGDYDLIVYVFRTSSGAFDHAQAVHVTVAR